MSDDFENPEIPDEDVEFVSKSQLKRDATALMDLGRKIVNMPKAKRDKLPLNDEIRDAIELADKIRNKRGGFKRQIQYIGKKLRSIDAEEIIAAVDKLEQKDKQNNAIFHRLEMWRDRLVAEDSDAMTEILEKYPHADRQHLRALVRNAVRETGQDKPPAAARALFKYLRELAETDQ